MGARLHAREGRAVTDDEAPYRGLMGDTPRLRVIEEMVASPDTPMTAEQMAAMIGSDDLIAVDAILDDLARREFALRLETYPTQYVANPASHRAIALTLLAFACADDAEYTGGTIMDGAIRVYLTGIGEEDRA